MNTFREVLKFYYDYCQEQDIDFDYTEYYSGLLVIKTEGVNQGLNEDDQKRFMELLALIRANTKPEVPLEKTIVDYFMEILEDTDRLYFDKRNHDREVM